MAVALHQNHHPRQLLQPVARQNVRLRSEPVRHCAVYVSQRRPEVICFLSNAEVEERMRNREADQLSRHPARVFRRYLQPLPSRSSVALIELTSMLSTGGRPAHSLLTTGANVQVLLGPSRDEREASPQLADGRDAR